MKKGFLLIGILMISLYLNGCGINNRGVDPGLENGATARFSAHDHQRGEGFGFWNQQRDRKNPIANIVARDERPGRGMNGILDQRPPSMNRRISRFEATREKTEMGRQQRALTNTTSHNNKNITKQITFEILQMNTVRDVRVITDQNRLMIAVDTETNDLQRLKDEISQLVKSKYANKEVIVVTDRHAVDRIRLLGDGFLRDETQSQEEDFFDNRTGPIVGQYK